MHYTDHEVVVVFTRCKNRDGVYDILGYMLGFPEYAWEVLIDVRSRTSRRSCVNGETRQWAEDNQREIAVLYEYDH